MYLVQALTYHDNTFGDLCVTCVCCVFQSAGLLELFLVRSEEEREKARKKKRKKAQRRAANEGGDTPSEVRDGGKKGRESLTCVCLSPLPPPSSPLPLSTGH